MAKDLEYVVRIRTTDSFVQGRTIRSAIEAALAPLGTYVDARERYHSAEFPESEARTRSFPKGWPPQ